MEVPQSLHRKYAYGLLFHLFNLLKYTVCLSVQTFGCTVFHHTCIERFRVQDTASILLIKVVATCDHTRITPEFASQQHATNKWTSG